MKGRPIEFSHEELSRYNGSEERQIYIAHQGKVYDVSGSKMWKTGTHMKRHQAGMDLTNDIPAAPHGTEVFERVKQVGILKPEKDPMDENLPDFLLALFKKIPMLRRHPHPMTVHFPIAFVMLIPVFNLLYLATRNPALEASAFHLTAAALIATPVAMLTGPYNWWVNYGGRWTGIIATKITTSVLLLGLIVTIFLWRAASPTIMLEPGSTRILYLLLSLCLVPVVTVLGWFGAKMTFPH